MNIEYTDENMIALAKSAEEKGVSWSSFVQCAEWAFREVAAVANAKIKAKTRAARLAKMKEKSE